MCVEVLLWPLLVGISIFSSAEFCIPDTNGTESTELCDRKDPKPSTQKLGLPSRESVMGVWMKTLFTNTFIRRTTLMVTRSQAEG